MFYKMKNSHVPDYLANLVPLTVGQSVPYSLRNRSDIQNVNFRTSFYKNTFLPSTIASFNSLPSHIQNAPSIAAFKNMLNTNTKPSSSPKHFYHGPRNLQILHTRLRTNCSSLAAHLFRKKNINDSPNCISCDEIEDCNHVFFHCAKFSVERAQLINSVSQICSPSPELQIIFTAEGYFTHEIFN